VVVDVDRDRVTVTLLSKDELRLPSQIRGAFESVPTMAFSSIREIKSFDVCWRKECRGRGVATVVALGLDGKNEGHDNGSHYGNLKSSGGKKN